MPEGMTVVQSQFDVRTTMDRMAAAITAHGVEVFARIDFTAIAAKAGLALRPTELLIFGSPRGGTPLMQADQTIGIDLPLKALIYEDEAGKTWLAYNDPHWLARRHGLAATAAAVDAMATALAALAAETTQSR